MARRFRLSGSALLKLFTGCDSYALIMRIQQILKGIVDEKQDINWGTLDLRVDMVMRIDDQLFQLMEE